jgi:hypothetical protein
MDDIRRTNAGKLLLSHGFMPVRYRSFGRVKAIGLSKLIEIEGRWQLISIEPIRDGKLLEYKIWVQEKGAKIYHVRGHQVIQTLNEIFASQGMAEIEQPPKKTAQTIVAKGAIEKQGKWYKLVSSEKTLSAAIKTSKAYQHEGYETTIEIVTGGYGVYIIMKQQNNS